MIHNDRRVQMLGDASFSIYLTHWFWLFRGFSASAEMIFSIVFGIGFHFAVERPMLHIFRSAIQAVEALIVRAPKPQPGIDADILQRATD
jgi:peptidoglycan/LPS O-acetylase OafA/YrhL